MIDDTLLDLTGEELTPIEAEPVSLSPALLAAAAESSIVIEAQPKNFVGDLGDTAYFLVIAQGEDLTYQWQHQLSAGGTWRASGAVGADTRMMSVQMTSTRLGYHYRCMISDSSGNQVITDPVCMLERSTIVSAPDRPFLSTPFSLYSVTDGLLLTLVLLIFGKALVRILKGGFSWLN